MNREWFSGKRIAIAGLGVSGIAVAEAVIQLGGLATVFDQKPGDSQQIIDQADRLRGIGVTVVTGWHGRIDASDFDLLVVSPGFPATHPAMTDMAEKVIGEIEFGYAIAKAPIIAITGTNGKSTTTVMTWLIVNGSGTKAHLCGNISGTNYPEKVFTSAALDAKEDEVLVVEVSSFQLETIEQFKPKAALITNISDDHLDRYESFSDYESAKLNLVKNMDENCTYILNGDEPSLRDKPFEELSLGMDIVYISPSGLHKSEGETRRRGDQVCFSGECIDPQELPFTGGHNMTNAMCAWELACCVVEPNIGMMSGLKSFVDLANRMENLGEKAGVTVINNSMCTNPAAVVASCRSVGEKNIHLIMGGNTKKMDYSILRDYLQDEPIKVYLFGEDNSLIREALKHNYPEYKSLGEAFTEAAKKARSGEVVMLAPGCSSVYPYANFRERGEAFRQIAKEWLDDKESQS